MDRPTVKPPTKGAPVPDPSGTAKIEAPLPLVPAAPSSIPTARIRLTSKEPPPLDPAATEGEGGERPSRQLHVVSEEVVYNRRADARVDDDE